MIIGYARVSTKEQNLERQVKELENFGCEKIFKEKQSGKDFKNRSVYKQMRSKLRFGDVLVVHDLSRLGRNKEEIKQEWESLTKPDDDDQGDSGAIDIVVLNMPILDTRKHKHMEGVGQLISELVLNILSWVVEDERERMRAAQREGIEIAKKQGKYTGRPFKYHHNTTGKDKVVYDRVVQLLKEKKSVMDIHREVGLSRNTIYRVKKDISTNNKEEGNS